MDGSQLTLVERAAARLRSQTEARASPSGLFAHSPAFSPAPGSAEQARPTEGLTRVRRQDFGARGRVETPRPPQVRFDAQRLRDLGLIDWAARRDQVTEEFRLIKRELLRHIAAKTESPGTPRNVILVTSAWAGEGKTFTALNLAINIAMEPDRRVLLLDACGSRGSLASLLQSPVDCGWLDAVAKGGPNFDGIVHNTHIPQLELVVPGRGSPNDAAPLASDRFRRLIEELAGCGDRIVLIDAPPCLVSSDPAVLAAIAGTTLLIVEANRTQQQSVEAATEILRASTDLQLILNKTQLAVTDTSGFYMPEHTAASGPSA